MYNEPKSMSDRIRIPVLGLIENMSFIVCSDCCSEHAIFAKAGGAKDANA